MIRTFNARKLQLIEESFKLVIERNITVKAEVMFRLPTLA